MPKTNTGFEEKQPSTTPVLRLTEGSGRVHARCNWHLSQALFRVLICLTFETTVLCFLGSTFLRIIFIKIISCLKDKFGYSHRVWRIFILMLNTNYLFKHQVMDNKGAYSYYRVENIIKSGFTLCQSHDHFLYEHMCCDF